MKSIKYFLVALLAITLTSCHLDMHIGQTHGNGNVVTEERHVNEDFDKVKGSAGLDV